MSYRWQDIEPSLLDQATLSAELDFEECALSGSFDAALDWDGNVLWVQIGTVQVPAPMLKEMIGAEAFAKVDIIDGSRLDLLRADWIEAQRASVQDHDDSPD